MRSIASIPPIPGIVISIITISGLCSLKALIPSSPDSASAITVISGSASISILKPILTTAWSSTNNILISLIAFPFPI